MKSETSLLSKPFHHYYNLPNNNKSLLKCPTRELVKDSPAVQEHRIHGFDPWVGNICWRREIAIHSSILAQKIPWTKETGRLQSKGLQRVGHD